MNCISQKFEWKDNIGIFKKSEDRLILYYFLQYLFYLSPRILKAGIN